MADKRDGDAGRIAEINRTAADILDPVADKLPAVVWDFLHDSISAAITTRDAALREARAEIEEARDTSHSLYDRAMQQQTEIDTLRIEIARLRSAPAARVVEAARKRAELEATGVASMREAREWDEEYDQVCSDLNQALAEYDATPPAAKNGEGIRNDPADSGNAFESGEDEGAAAERARIVVWLREIADADEQKTLSDAAVYDVARRIERGEHASAEGKSVPKPETIQAVSEGRVPPGWPTDHMETKRDE